ALAAPSPEAEVCRPLPSSEPGAGVLTALPDSAVAAALSTQHSDLGTQPVSELGPAAAVLPSCASLANGAAASECSAATSLPDSPPPAPEAPARNPRNEAKAKLEELIRKHQLNVIAIGNGTACRETEELISELIAERLADLAYVIVNEAGASVYSTSAV